LIEPSGVRRRRICGQHPQSRSDDFGKIIGVAAQSRDQSPRTAVTRPEQRCYRLLL